MSTTRHEGVGRLPSAGASAQRRRPGTHPVGSGATKVGTAPDIGRDRRSVEVPRGQTSEAERPWRAAALTFVGSASILFFAYPRELTLTNVQWLSLWGQLVGMVGLVLALFMVIYPRAANVIGPFAIISGIVGFPIMLGGVLVGSFALVLGGGLAFSWEPAPPEATAEVSRSLTHLPLRIAAGIIDLVLLLIAVAIPATTFLHDPMRDYPALTYLVELGLWAAIFLPGAMRGVSPGKLLMRLRAWEKGTDGRPGTRAAIIREAVRGAQVLAGVMLLPWIVHLPETGAAVRGAGVVAALVLSAHVGWTIHDHFAGTEVVALRVRLPRDGETGSGQVDVDAAALLTREPTPPELDMSELVPAELVAAGVATNGSKHGSKNGARRAQGNASSKGNGSTNGSGGALGAMRVHPARSSQAVNGNGATGNGGRARATTPRVTHEPRAAESRPRRTQARQTGAAKDDPQARGPAER